LTLERFVLSFFKNHGIQNYLIKDHQAVYQCLKCSEESVIHLMTTLWRCEHCNMQGTLNDLMQMKINEHTKSAPSRFFNPRKEKNEIQSLLRGLMEDYKEDNRIEKIYQKIDDLFCYFISKLH
jgi:predicted ATP-dependent serine protease